MIGLSILKRAIADVPTGGMQTGDPKVQLKLCDAQRIEVEYAAVIAERDAALAQLAVYPMQPISTDELGVARFERNLIIDWLCTEKSNMNEVAIYAAENGIDEKYQQQVAQLVGYSISGYGNLSYVNDENYERAQLRAKVEKK